MIFCQPSHRQMSSCFPEQRWVHIRDCNSCAQIFKGWTNKTGTVWRWEEKIQFCMRYVWCIFFPPKERVTYQTEADLNELPWWQARLDGIFSSEMAKKMVKSGRMLTATCFKDSTEWPISSVIPNFPLNSSNTACVALQFSSCKIKIGAEANWPPWNSCRHSISTRQNLPRPMKVFGKKKKNHESCRSTTLYLCRKQHKACELHLQAAISARRVFNILISKYQIRASAHSPFSRGRQQLLLKAKMKHKTAFWFGSQRPVPRSIFLAPNKKELEKLLPEFLILCLI